MHPTPDPDQRWYVDAARRSAWPFSPWNAKRARTEAEGRVRAISMGVKTILLALLVFVWLANSAGLLSSNDGSHLALARALVLRGQSQIDPDRALTLEVDLAERAGHAYSDRPPGTAFVALPSVWIGARLDPAMFERAMRQARAKREVDPLPGAPPYIATYAKRTSAAGGSAGPRLAELIGTSVAISIHAAMIGLIGVLLLAALIRRLQAPSAGSSPRLFALACLGLGSAWGPYASALFSHVSAATAVAGFLLGVVVLEDPDRRSKLPVTAVAALTGLAGAWAISCDYLLILGIIPASLLAIDRRWWPAVLLGTVPITAATLAYHHAAFGGVFEVGYDHHSNFEFARARGSTFSGNFFEGMWTLWGLGRGAGLLAQSPITLVGLLAVPLISWRERSSNAAPSHTDPTPHAALLRALAGFMPWVLALALHRTPWGGGTEDHRYLIPLLPFAAIGLSLAWARASPLLRVALVALALGSTILVWRHFLAWHETPAFDRPALGAAAAALVVCCAAILAMSAALRRKLRGS
jgi:hypothetical protein